MKGLKKLALVSAIAVAPFAAQAELKAMDDAMMGDVTGQAGVTIELETLINIGSFVYTDEGTFTVNNITLGGSLASGLASAAAAPTASQTLNDIYIDIDVLADGDALISLHSIVGAPIDWGFKFDNAVLAGGGESTVVMQNLAAWGFLTVLDFRVDTATDTLNVMAGFTVQQLNVDFPFLAVGIRGMSITSNDTKGTVAAAQAAGKLSASAAGAILATNSAYVNMTMGAGTSTRVAAPVLAITVDAFEADVNIAAVVIGGTSIGSVAFNDLQITNTTLKVYGHN
jgi:hypothetical protein